MSSRESVLLLLRRATQTVEKMVDDSVGELTTSQLLVLEALDRCDAPPTQKKLGTATSIDRSTLADIVRRLLDRGLVSRTRLAIDRRAYAVRITSAGRKALAKAETLRRGVEVTALNAIKLSERAAVMRGLECLATLQLEAPA